MRETQLGPWPWRRRLRPKLGGSGGGFGRGRGGKDEGLTYYLFVAADGWRSTGSWPADGAQGAQPRRCSAPASSQPGTRRGRHREVVGGLGRLREVSACGGIGHGRGGSPTARTGRAGRRCGLRGDGRCAAFIGRVQRQDARLQCHGTATDIGLRAQGRRRRTPGQSTAAVQCGTKMWHASLEGRRGGEPTALTSRRWGTSLHRRRGKRGSLCAARGTTKPAGRPARRQRFRARPSSISAGQRDFDCTVLQKVELCDKNARYESCR
jgi:hypothetical protein